MTVPDDAALAALLDRHAPLKQVPLCPGLLAFSASSLIGVWEAAERLAGAILPAPFWAYPWAAGAALSRVLLDQPERVRGRRVLDLGCGGGVAAFACARAGAAVVANDIDPWALTVTRLGAARQRLALTTLLHDFTLAPDGIEAYDVVLCSDLAYDRSTAPLQRAVLDRAARAGAHILVADAGRVYFEAEGLDLIAQFEMAVPRDLEGVDVRVACVYAWPRRAG